MLNIEFSIVCDTGKKRMINQDNFWCQGEFLPKDNNGLSGDLSGETFDYNKIFAVFDGMGGEALGEVAAYLCAKHLDSKSKNCKDIPLSENFFFQLCRDMNSDVCDYASANKIYSMGSTLALIAFSGENAFVVNVGDSKIFQFNNSLNQISVDHILDIGGNRKPSLSQCIGVPETEFLIEPHIAGLNIKKDDIFLLCSDGLTDMVAISDIEKVIAKNISIREKAEKLLKKALKAGGRDNVTIMFLQVKEVTL